MCRDGCGGSETKQAGAEGGGRRNGETKQAGAEGGGRCNGEEVAMVGYASSSSSSSWSKLPEDLKVEILCRLEEVKFLIPAKCVSKEWNFLISNVCVRRFSPPSPLATFCGLFLSEECHPSEIETETEEQAEETETVEEAEETKTEEAQEAPVSSGGDATALRLLFHALHDYQIHVHLRQVVLANTTILDKLYSSLPGGWKPPDILDCCNGLFLAAASADSQAGRPTQYYICNPVTEEQIAVPVNPTHHDYNSYHRCPSSLVFDPSHRRGNAYGYNYEIIRFIRSARDATTSNPIKLDVFSSETGEWSSHVLPVLVEPLYGFDWMRQSVYWEGILYYVSLAGYLVCIDIHMLLSSDDDSKKACFLVELPDKGTTAKPTTPEKGWGCIGISSGCFYYSNRHCISSESESTLAISLWTLVVKGRRSSAGSGCSSEWILMHRMKLDDIRVSRKKLKSALPVSWPFAFHPSNDRIYMAVQEPPFLFSYRPEIKCAKLIHVPELLIKTILDPNLIFPYSQCLVSLRSFTAQSNHDD